MRGISFWKSGRNCREWSRKGINLKRKYWSYKNRYKRLEELFKIRITKLRNYWTNSKYSKNNATNHLLHLKITKPPHNPTNPPTNPNPYTSKSSPHNNLPPHINLANPPEVSNSDKPFNSKDRSTSATSSFGTSSRYWRKMSRRKLCLESLWLYWRCLKGKRRSWNTY